MRGSAAPRSAAKELKIRRRESREAPGPQCRSERRINTVERFGVRSLQLPLLWQVERSPPKGRTRDSETIAGTNPSTTRSLRLATKAATEVTALQRSLCSVAASSSRERRGRELPQRCEIDFEALAGVDVCPFVPEPEVPVRDVGDPAPLPADRPEDAPQLLLRRNVSFARDAARKHVDDTRRAVTILRTTQKSTSASPSSMLMIRPGSLPAAARTLRDPLPAILE